MPAGRIRISLQTKILAAVLLCVTLPIGLMGGYLLQRNEEVLQQKARETLSNHLFRKATQVDEWMDQRLRDVQRWSASFIVFEGVESLSRPGSDAARVRVDLRDYLESVMAHYRAYESLFVVDLQGRVVSGTSDEGLERWGQELLAGTSPLRGPVISPIHRSERLGRPTLLILQDIQGRAGHVIGYFVARVDLRELEALLRTGVEVDPAPDFWLLDARNRILLRAGNLVERPGEDPFSAPLPEPTAAPAAAVGEARLPGLGPTVYGLQPLRGALAGTLAATVSVSAAYKPLNEARNRLLKVTVPALLALLAGTFLVARRLLRPIERLSEGASRVAQGDLDVHLPVQGNDELADLTRAFNEMAWRIREGRASLEQARDDLARANEDLEKGNRQLEELARTDGLTGLFNRRHFQQRMDTILEKSEKEGSPSASCCSTSTTSSSTTTAGATPRATPSFAGWRLRSCARCARPTRPSATGGGAGRAAARLSQGAGHARGGEDPRGGGRRPAEAGPLRRAHDHDDLRGRGHLPGGRPRGAGAGGYRRRRALRSQGRRPRPRGGRARPGLEVHARRRLTSSPRTPISSGPRGRPGPSWRASWPSCARPG